MKPDGRCLIYTAAIFAVSLIFCMSAEYLISDCPSRIFQPDKITAQILSPFSISCAAVPMIIAFINSIHPNLMIFAVSTVFIIAIIIICAIFIILHMQSYEKLRKKNQQLKQAISKAEQAVRVKSSFLSRMSHELLSPMDAIIGMTELAKRNIDDKDKVIQYLDKISYASNSTLELINDMLDMSAIENDKLKIASESFDLLKFLSSLSSVSYMQCRAKDIKFDMVLSGVTEPRIIGDQLRLSQILNNLLSNAIKFTPEGGEIHLEVTQLRTDDEKVYLQFAVSDTGCGMSEELTEKLFKPFEPQDTDELDNSESESCGDKFSGSGIGMCIIKNLVDMMGGTVSVKSQKNTGTTFTVNLAFEKGESEKEKNNTDSNKYSASVLLIDDDNDTREYAVTVLNRMNIAHCAVNSADSAIELLNKLKNESEIGFDICFVSWKMNNADSLEFLRELRRLCGQDIVIVVMSSFDISLIEDEAREAGADRFVSKPLFESTISNELMNIDTLNRLESEADEIISSDNTVFNEFTGKNILLAESNEMSMEIAVEILSMGGFIVDCAENGKAAFSKFKQSETGFYDVILMNLDLPKMDGFETARAIRECERPDAAEIPIIAMIDGESDEIDDNISECIEAGFNDHVIKPIDTMGLFDTLKEYLSD